MLGCTGIGRPYSLAHNVVVVGYPLAMRLHIMLDDVLVGDLDRVVGARERSSFIAKAVHRAIEELERSEALEAALGSIWTPLPSSTHFGGGPLRRGCTTSPPGTRYC